MTRLYLGVLIFTLVWGCTGVVHLDLQPRVLAPSAGGAPSQEPPGPDPTRPLNLPDTRF
jgi:hypothetical protein